MANGESTTAPVPVRPDDTPPTVIRPELVAAVEILMDDIPEAGQDAFESIIGNLLTANDARDLDAPWRTAGLGELANARIVVHGIRKSPSDYPGGLPFFLLVDGAYEDTGEIFTVTTGASSVVVQLAKAHNLHAFPLRCIPRIADRPSRNGYRPMHLEMIP